MRLQVRFRERVNHVNSTQHGRLLARKANRLASRSNMQHTSSAGLVSQMKPHRASRLTSPPPVQDTIVVNKRIQIAVPIPAGTLSVLVTTQMLMAGVPGGLTYWNRVRIDRLDFWTNSSHTSGTDTLTVAVAASTSWDQPPVEWTDTGVVGQRRAHIGFTPGLLDRARYFNTADAGSICAVGVDGEGEQVVICQAQVQLMSNILT
jgi:hypothetical protein